MDTANRNFDLEERLLEYAANIIRLTEGMRCTQAGVHVAGQLLWAGTAALPNHGEAQAAESTADFIHKMSVCLKELRETRRWLLLVQRIPLVKTIASVDPLRHETEELIKIFYTSIATAKKRSLHKARPDER
jgi:four helix bundle protein